MYKVPVGDFIVEGVPRKETNNSEKGERRKDKKEIKQKYGGKKGKWGSKKVRSCYSFIG